MTGTGKETCAESKAQIIRELNDRFRCTLVGGIFVATPGIQALGSAGIAQLMREVATFDKFEEANDPYGEHDFGALKDGAEPIFWKIDYYDKDLLSGSPDPADPEVTLRVLTLMLASEY